MGVRGGSFAGAVLLALAACGGSGSGNQAGAQAGVPAAAPSNSASPGDGAGSGPSPSGSSPSACTPPAGRLTLYAIPPPSALDWSSPNALLASVAASSVAGTALVTEGKAALGHEIGHVNVELDCGADSIPLTGMTSAGGSDWQSGADGFGVVFRDFPGELTEVPGADHDAMVSDVALRQKNGLLTRVTFRVGAPMCTRLKAFHDAYVAHGGPQTYGGLPRARRFEGAGCAVFGEAVVDVGGLLRRSLVMPAWARSEFVGSARFSNVLGSPYYKYGGNAVARDPSGKSWIWPKGVDIPASSIAACVPGSATMDAWNGPEDTAFDVPGLPDPMSTKVPFTLLDPQLIAAWAEQVWQAASAAGSSSSLGATWTAGQVDGVHEITNDATCVAPQTIPFEADNDDLFADSDAP
jgi:hypothetical protein